VPALEGALADGSTLVRGHAAWALSRLGRRTGAARTCRPLLEKRLAIEHDPYVREELELALAELAEGDTDGRTHAP
jgi:epoxyqueuosine reductase